MQNDPIKEQIPPHCDMETIDCDKNRQLRHEEDCKKGLGIFSVFLQFEHGCVDYVLKSVSVEHAYRHVLILVLFLGILKHVREHRFSLTAFHSLLELLFFA